MSGQVLFWVLFSSATYPSVWPSLTSDEGLLWQRNDMRNLALKWTAALVVENVPRAENCASLCRASSDCPFFFYSQETAACHMCKTRCTKDDLRDLPGAFTFHRRKMWKRCPEEKNYRYYSEVNMCLKFYMDTGGNWWFNARRACLLEGGHLVTFHSDQEYETLKVFLNETLTYLRDVKGKPITNPNFNNPWLGAEKTGSGQWVWEDGSLADPVLAGKWLTNQPNGDQLAKLSLSVQDGCKLGDQARDQYRHFVCQIDLLP